MQEEAVVFLLLCEELFIYQLSTGNDMFLENPASSSIFYHRIAQRILALRIKFRGKVRRVVHRTSDMCAFGKTNPEGEPIRKRLGFLVTEEIADSVVRACVCRKKPGAKSLHAWIEGKETRGSMVYPDLFVDTVLGRVQERKSESEAMYGLLDTEHGVVESYH